jgi:outer membrane lipoprotein SlyB
MAADGCMHDVSCIANFDQFEDMNMLRNRGLIVLMLVALFALNACVAPPPHQRVVYRDPASQGYGPPPQGYPPPQGAPPQSGSCYTCGYIRGIDQVEIRQQNTGGGAVLGAIIGGVIGNQFGGGSGKAAATAAGVVGGAMVGNSVEANNAHAGYAWRYYVQLDDGRQATVSQYDNPGYHVGDRVVIRGNGSGGHLEWLRE